MIRRFDATTGELEWTAVIPEMTMSCLTVWDELVLVPSYNDYSSPFYSPLYAFDRSTGETVWATPIPVGFWDSSPVVVDSTIYISSMNSAVFALDCLNGDIVWTTSLRGSITATLSYHDGFLVRVFDLSGRMIVDAEIPEGSNGQMEMDVSGMPPGVYLVRWTQEECSGSSRLVVVR